MSLPNFDSFKAQFNGDLVTPSDPDYDQAIARWAANAIRRAALVTYPKDAQDVSAVVKWVSVNKIPLAVRGGGHSSTGASSAEDGVVIDLSRYFRGAKVDPEKKLAYVGGGAVWKEVDEAAIQHGLATPGGTVNHTGVGGLILGGGYGYLTGEHGLVIDNLEEATIVTGDGSIRKASAAENTDIFWGIRGGGGNFGVVTEFVLRLHTQRPTVFAGFVAFPPSIVEKAFNASYEWFAETKGLKSSLLLIVANPPPERKTMVLAVIFYNGSEEEGREHFKWLYDLGPVADQAKEMPYEQVNGLVATTAPHGRGVCMSGASQKTPAIAMKLFDAYSKYSAENPDMSIMWGFEYFGLSKLRQVPSDATAFPSRMAPSNILMQCIFDGKGPNLPERTQRAREILKNIKAIALDAVDEVPTYGNYEDAIKGVGEHLVTNVGSMAPDKGNAAAEALFRDNYPRLQRIKAKYDPNGLFNRWYAITPEVQA